MISKILGATTSNIQNSIKISKNVLAPAIGFPCADPTSAPKQLLKQVSYGGSEKKWKSLQALFFSYLYLSGHLYESFTEHPIDFKPALMAGLFSLIPTASAYSITRTEPVERASSPIAVIASLSTLTLTPNVEFTQQINIKEYFELSNRGTNLALSIEQTDGTPAPSWLSLNMGEPSTIKWFYTNGYAADIIGNGSNAYLALSTGIQIIDFSDINNPSVIGSYSQSGITYPSQSSNYYGKNLLLNGGNLFLANGQEINIFDVSSPASIVYKSTISFPVSNGFVDMALAGNYLYCALGCPSAGNCPISLSV